MSGLPSSIQVGPYRFTIIEDEATYNRKVVEDDANTWGTIEYGRLRIILNPNQAPDHKRVTLLHELLHGVEDISDQAHDNTEKVIRQLAAPLLDVLRRNPELVAYLLEQEE